MSLLMSWFQWCPSPTMAQKRYLEIGRRQMIKTGERYKASYYHPVSLTCVLCKCMEPTVASQIMQHPTKNNIQYNYQHGFRSKFSTETQLIAITEDMLRGMKDRKQSDVFVMDLAKAFDNVSHIRLLQKLHMCGTDPETC